MAEKKSGMTIRTKLLSTVVFLVIISVSVGSLAYYGFWKARRAVQEVTEQTIPDLALADEVNTLVAAARRYEKEFFLFSSLGTRSEAIRKKQEEYYGKMKASFNDVGKGLDRLKGSSMFAAVSEQSAQEETPRTQQLKELSANMAVVETAYRNTIQSMDPMAVELLGGKGFLEVSKLYEVYRGNVRSLEEGVGNIHKNILAYVNLARDEMDTFSQFLTRGLLVSGIGVVFLGIVIGLFVANRVSGSLRQLLSGVQNVKTGKFQEVSMKTGDELEEIAAAFNQTMGSLRGYLQSDGDREMTQENVIRFLDVVSHAAEGDLTMKAPVTADVFGNIADAFNVMVDGLGHLLTDVRKSAYALSQESQQLMGFYKELEGGAEDQMAQVKKATGSVDETSATTQEISQKATHAQEVSSTVDQATSDGNRMVKQNIEGMQVIRVTVQGINKKMKSLSERLMEIGTISQLISEVASRTTILAMNASIEAARAGAQGRGFLVIADEIKGLADKSAEATKQINGIIRAIQTEASEVTASLEEETRTVEAQTRLAQDTGEAFKEVEKAIGESRTVVSEIFDLSQRQRGFTVDAVGSMEEVSKISVKALKLVKDSAAITHGMSQMADMLQSSLSPFRLPEFTSEATLSSDHEESTYEVAEEVSLYEDVEETSAS